MLRKLIVLIVAMISISFVFAGIISTPGNAIGHLEEERYAPAASTEGAFAFVSEFMSGSTLSDYGWHVVNGNPDITSVVNYSGEHSLEMPAGAQVYSDTNITSGNQLVSFQFAVNSANGNGSFTIVNAQNRSVAFVAVNGTTIYAGSSPESIEFSGQVPQTPAYKGGWIYVSGNLMNTSTHKSFNWTLQLFVDQTISIFANISCPLGYEYSAIELNSTYGIAYFTDIVFTSYEIPIYLPGYNNMEGYGQGSGLLVQLLKPFTILHANMILHNWNTLENGILSFQINAMNYYGATRSTCVGFFQLGIDLDPNGTIAPWYVAGTNCIAHYFLHSMNPAVQPGFPTPNNTRLGLTIIDNISGKHIFFQIIDYSVQGNDRYWNATIPYNGTLFYATYTQMEFQPVAESQILNYHFNGTLYNMTYGNSFSSMTMLNNSYMLPFTLDAPDTWSLTYYNGEAGYTQIA